MQEAELDPIVTLKSEIEQMIGLSTSDSEMFWALSKKCTGYAMVPAVAAGAKWGTALIAAGTVTLPGLGTVSGTTAAVMLMAGAWGASYMACMSLLPGLMKFRDDLVASRSTLATVREDVAAILTRQRFTPIS